MRTVDIANVRNVDHHASSALSVLECGVFTAIRISAHIRTSACIPLCDVFEFECERSKRMPFKHLSKYTLLERARRRHIRCPQCRSPRLLCSVCARVWCPYCHSQCPALHVDTPLGTPIISIPINPPILSTPAPGATTRRPHRRTQPSTHRIELPPELQTSLKPLMSFLATQGWTLKAYNPDPSKTFDYILIGTMPILPDKAWEFFPQKLVDMYRMQPPQKYMKTVPPQLVVSVKLPKR